MVMLLNELIDPDDEKPTRAKTRRWIQRREENGNFFFCFETLSLQIGDESSMLHMIYLTRKYCIH